MEAEKSIDTLKDWVNQMVKNNPDKAISLRTHKNLNELFNPESKKNLIVFDNSGGQLLCCWELDSEKQVNAFLKEFKDYLVFGWCINGESFLSEYQKQQPHWNLFD